MGNISGIVKSLTAALSVRGTLLSSDVMWYVEPEPEETGVLTSQNITLIVTVALILAVVITIIVVLNKKSSRDAAEIKRREAVERANAKLREKKIRENETLLSVLDRDKDKYTDDGITEEEMCSFTKEAMEAAKKIKQIKRVKAKPDSSTPEVMIDGEGRRKIDEDETLRTGKRGIRIKNGEMEQDSIISDDDASAYRDEKDNSNAQRVAGIIADVLTSAVSSEAQKDSTEEKPRPRPSWAINADIPDSQSPNFSVQKKPDVKSVPDVSDASKDSSDVALDGIPKDFSFSQPSPAVSFF